MRATLENETGRGKLIDGSEPARPMKSAAAALAGEEAIANPKARGIGRRWLGRQPLFARVVATPKSVVDARGR